MAIAFKTLLCNRPSGALPGGLRFKSTRENLASPIGSDTRRIVCFYPADFLRPRSLSIITFTRPVYFVVLIFLKKAKR